MLEQIIQPFFAEWLDAFFDPRKRIFWGYLLAALAIAVGWMVLLRDVSIRSAMAAFFQKGAWWSPTARVDYTLLLINSALMVFLSRHLFGKVAVAYVVFTGLHGLFEGRPTLPIELADWQVAPAFTLFLFLLDDFARYWLHRWLHTVSVLWAFHRVHHTATALNPFTVFRTHPVEAILFSVRSAVVQGSAVALFFFFFGDQVTLVTVLGASVFTFLFNILGSNLRHSPIPIGFWRPVERVFMSPAQHQVHHSLAVDHRDRNYGVALAVWDWMFATHCFSERDQVLRYGVPGPDQTDEHHVARLYFMPFVDVWRRFVVRFFRPRVRTVTGEPEVG